VEGSCDRVREEEEIELLTTYIPQGLRVFS
jgi:hypothetical protein